MLLVRYLGSGGYCLLVFRGAHYASSARQGLTATPTKQCRETFTWNGL